MRKFKQKRLAKAVLALCLALLFSGFAVISGAAANMNFAGRMGKRTTDTTDVPPIGEGLEDGVNDITDGIESGVEDIVDGAESSADRAESSMDGGFETNIPDSDIGGALKDDDGDGISNHVDSDDDNDGVSDASDTDADNDGISDKNDPDPDGDGVDESKMSSTLMGIGIAVLVIAGAAILIYALMPKKKR